MGSNYKSLSLTIGDTEWDNINLYNNGKLVLKVRDGRTVYEQPIFHSSNKGTIMVWYYKGVKYISPNTVNNIIQ